MTQATFSPTMDAAAVITGPHTIKRITRKVGEAPKIAYIETGAYDHCAVIARDLALSNPSKFWTVTQIDRGEMFAVNTQRTQITWLVVPITDEISLEIEPKERKVKPVAEPKVKAPKAPKVKPVQQFALTATTVGSPDAKPEIYLYDDKEAAINALYKLSMGLLDRGWEVDQKSETRVNATSIFGRKRVYRVVKATPKK